MNEWEEDRARREIAAVTNQDFANCVYPPKPRDRTGPSWRELMCDCPICRPRPANRRFELPPNRLTRVIWPDTQLRWTLDVGEFEFYTQQDQDLIRFNIRVRRPNGQVEGWGGVIPTEAVGWNYTHQLFRKRIDNKVAVVIECDHGSLHAFVELED